MSSSSALQTVVSRAPPHRPFATKLWPASRAAAADETSPVWCLPCSSADTCGSGLLPARATSGCCRIIPRTAARIWTNLCSHRRGNHSPLHARPPCYAGQKNGRAEDCGAEKTVPLEKGEPCGEALVILEPADELGVSDKVVAGSVQPGRRVGHPPDHRLPTLHVSDLPHLPHCDGRWLTFKTNESRCW